MRILLASARFDLRLALEILLREEPGIDIVGTAGEAASVRSLLRSSLPDLLILDWDLPGHDPSHLLAETKRLRCRPEVIVLGRYESARQEALAAGADAFVLGSDLPDVLVAAIRNSRARRRAGHSTAATPGGGTRQDAASSQNLEGTQRE